MKDADNTTFPTMNINPEAGSNWEKGEALTLNAFINILDLTMRFCDEDCQRIVLTIIEGPEKSQNLHWWKTTTPTEHVRVMDRKNNVFSWKPTYLLSFHCDGY